MGVSKMMLVVTWTLGNSRLWDLLNDSERDNECDAEWDWLSLREFEKLSELDRLRLWLRLWDADKLCEADLLNESESLKTTVGRRGCRREGDGHDPLGVSTSNTKLN